MEKVLLIMMLATFGLAQLEVQLTEAVIGNWRHLVDHRAAETPLTKPKLQSLIFVWALAFWVPLYPCQGVQG